MQPMSPSRSPNGKWAIVQQDLAGVTDSLVSSETVTFDAWHEYEIILWNDDTVSFMVDRQRLCTKDPLPLAAAWMFAEGGPGLVVGVLDFEGVAPFTVYYDDAGIASVSNWSCDRRQ